MSIQVLQFKINKTPNYKISKINNQIYLNDQKYN